MSIKLAKDKAFALSRMMDRFGAENYNGKAGFIATMLPENEGEECNFVTNLPPDLVIPILEGMLEQMTSLVEAVDVPKGTTIN